MTLWPRTLFGRLVLILLAGLVAAHALSFTVLVVQRAAAARAVMSYFVAQDIASAVAILEQVAPSERALWLGRLEREHYRFVLGATARGAPLREGPALEVAAAARRALGPRYPIEASTGAASRYALHTRLADGTPFTVLAKPPGMVLPGELPLVFALQLLILAACTWVAVRLATRPLAQLATAAQAAGTDAPQALAESGPLEVARAAKAFNAMQRRIASHLAERMHILAAIAHDLQTPITRMRLRTDMLDDAAQRDKMLGDLAAMQTLVDDGILYARNAQGLRETPCRTDLDALLSSVVYDYLDSGHAVALQGRLGHPIGTYPQALRRILTNLLDNALKFGSAVELVLEQGPAGVSISVRDRGPGLAPDQLTAVFEPFYRVDDSRSRESGGSGLGLAIVRQLADAMDARISLANRDGGGLEARLVLPSYRAANP